MRNAWGAGGDGTSRQHRYFLQKYFHTFVTSREYSASECTVLATAQIHSDLIPPPQQRISAIHTWSSKKEGKTCQLPEHDILPVIPLFFFSGVTLDHRAGMTCLFHRGENTEGRAACACGGGRGGGLLKAVSSRQSLSLLFSLRLKHPEWE